MVKLMMIYCVVYYRVLGIIQKGVGKNYLNIEWCMDIKCQIIYACYGGCFFHADQNYLTHPQDLIICLNLNSTLFIEFDINDVIMHFIIYLHLMTHEQWYVK